MKTKHILTALALPAMFAACTADDIVSQDNGLQQDQRAKLSKDFVLNVNNEVESRYAVEGTTGLEFTFEEGDLIGANLIDSYEPGTGYAYTGVNAWDKEDPATWKIVKTVAPALPFENKDGKWMSAGELGIGNYLFTNPYNPEDKNRASAKYELPVVVHYDSKNPNAHIEEYNKAVAAAILREGDMMANISLKNLYTYPKIRINFDKDDEVTKVTKVILAKAHGNFIYKGAFDHEEIARMFNPATLEAEMKADKKLTKEAYWASKQTSDFIIDTEEEQKAAANFIDLKETPYFIYEMDEKVSSNRIEVRFMLPSIEDFTNVDSGGEEAIIMYVCTDKGNFEMELTDAKNYKWSNTTLAAKKAAALWRNASNTLTTEVGALSPASDEIFIDNIVSTAADWNALVEKYGDLKKYSAEYNAVDKNGNKINSDALPMYVTILDDDFALTSDLDMPEVAEFIIKTDVGVEGAVTLKNIKMENATLTVKKGATLTTDPTLVAPEVEVEAGGELVFAAAYDEDEELVAYTKVETVCNHGTVTVPAGVIAEFNLQNADKGAVLNVGAETRAAAEAVANLEGYNYGVINNYSVINVIAGSTGSTEAKFVNNAPSESETIGYIWDAEDKVWDAAPTINNFGTFNAKGKTVNYGVFNNNGVLTSSFVGEAYFINGKTKSNDEESALDIKDYKAVLNIAKNAETYIDQNNNWAEIVLAELNPAKFTIHNAKDASAYANAYCGVIKYVMNDKSANQIDLSTSPVTYLVTNVGIDLTKTYNYMASGATVATVKALPTLEVNGGTLKISTTKNAATTPAYVAQVSNLVINGEVNVDGEIASVGHVTINPDAVLGVPAGSKLSVATFNSVETLAGAGDAKLGKLAVNGALHLTNVSNDTGVYGTEVPATVNIVLHKGVTITCAKNAADPNVYDINVYFRSGTLKTVKNQADYKSVDSNDTYTLWIETDLDMSVKDNIDNVAVLNNAKLVVLNGGNIKNLKGSAGADVKTLEVSKPSTIQGTEKVVVLKADELINKAGLVIESGYIEMNLTAAEGMGCEKISNSASLIGTIVAKNANSNYLYWNASEKVWAQNAKNYTVTGTTLAASMAQVNSSLSTSGTVILTQDVSGDGLKLTQDANAEVVIDLNGKVLNVSGDAVGSTGTKTLGMQLLKGNKVTIKNGTIKATSDKVLVLIMNYADLTLENVTLVHTNDYGYALDCNNGTVVIDNCEISANTGKVALGVYNNKNYSNGTNVTIKGETTINGDIEYGAHSSFTSETWVSTLKFEGDNITLNGKLKGNADTTSNGRWPHALKRMIEGEQESWL